MAESLFLAGGLGLLLSLQKPSQALRVGRMENLRKLVDEALEIFLQASAALFLWSWALSTKGPLPAENFSFWAVTALVYGLNRIRKTEPLFVPVAAFCFLMLSQNPDGVFWKTVLERSALFSGLLLCIRMGHAALRHRLLFSDAPEILKGTPLVLAGLAIFLMALSCVCVRLGF